MTKHELWVQQERHALVWLHSAYILKCLSTNFPIFSLLSQEELCTLVEVAKYGLDTGDAVLFPSTEQPDRDTTTALCL